MWCRNGEGHTGWKKWGHADKAAISPMLGREKEEKAHRGNKALMQSAPLNGLLSLLIVGAASYTLPSLLAPQELFLFLSEGILLY